MRLTFAICLAPVWLLCSCGGQPPPNAAPSTGAASAAAGLVGATTRIAIEEREPAWARATEESSPDGQAAAELAAVSEGAEVVIYLGTWCGDSLREVPRLWAALDLAGQVPFAVRLVEVDRAKEAPEVTADVDLRYVPTFVVLRGGAEVGRIVESSPNGIEADLGRLLRGEATGVISGRGGL